MAGTGHETGDPNESVPRIVKTDDVLGGDPRIEGRRIGVYHVYQQYVDGDVPPERIADGYDISVAEVHTALAYAFSTPEEMGAIERRNENLHERDPAHRVTPDEGA